MLVLLWINLRRWTGSLCESGNFWPGTEVLFVSNLKWRWRAITSSPDRKKTETNSLRNMCNGLNISGIKIRKRFVYIYLAMGVAESTNQRRLRLLCHCRLALCRPSIFQIYLKHPFRPLSFGYAPIQGTFKGDFFFFGLSSDFFFSPEIIKCIN